MQKSFLVGCVFSLVLATSAVQAATATLNLSWTVTNSPTVPATHYRIEELVSSTWTTQATVPAPQLTHQFTGRTIGQTYRFRIVPLNNGVAGTPSNEHTCGAVPSDATITFSCGATVVP